MGRMDTNKPAGPREVWNTSLRPLGTSLSLRSVGVLPNQREPTTQQSAVPLEPILGPIAFGLQRVSRALKPVLEFMQSPETIEILKGLLIITALYEKHGGNQKAFVRALVERRLGRKADALLVTKLQDVRTKPLSEFLTLVDHHKRRLGRDEVIVRREAVRASLRMYGSLEKARSILAAYHKEGREQILLDEIVEAVCEEQASRLSNKDLAGVVGNRIRRDATESRKKLPANFTDVGVFNQAGVENEIEAREILLFLQQVADAAAHQKPPSQQELEALIITAYTEDDAEASMVLGRPKNQIKQERFRAGRKLRRAADGSSS